MASWTWRSAGRCATPTRRPSWWTSATWRVSPTWSRQSPSPGESAAVGLGQARHREFARALAALGWEIVSTGGTAAALKEAGVPVLPIEQVTGFPEIMDGRVKTLHPKVHGGLLARRHHPGDVAALQQHGITPIDLVAVNLYPFRDTIARPDVRLEQAIEQIDIGR